MLSRRAVTSTMMWLAHVPVVFLRSRQEQDMAAKYQLKEGRTGKWRWNLLARNGRVIATSEPYETKRSALAGIESVRRNADAPLEDLSSPAPATRTAAGGGGARKAAPLARKTAPAATATAKKTAPAARSTAKKTAPAARSTAKKTAPAASSTAKKAAPPASSAPPRKTASAAKKPSPGGRAASADGSAPAPARKSAKTSATSGANRRRTTPDTTTAQRGARRTSRAAARDLEAAAVPRAEVAAAAYSPEVQGVLEQALPGGTAPPSAASADAALGLDPVEPAGR
jgi:uncharacterized protein YegP (UPF0339 family)